MSIPSENIAIQAIEGSFYPAIAQACYGKDVYVNCCGTFADLTNQAVNKSVKTGVLAI